MPEQTHQGPQVSQEEPRGALSEPKGPQEEPREEPGGKQESGEPQERPRRKPNREPRIVSAPPVARGSSSQPDDKNARERTGR